MIYFVSEYLHETIQIFWQKKTFESDQLLTTIVVGSNRNGILCLMPEQVICSFCFITENKSLNKLLLSYSF